MIFKELLLKYPWDEIETVLIQLYPDQAQNSVGYRHVYKTLLGLRPTTMAMYIVIETVIDEVTQTPYANVSGRDGVETYALEFTDWHEWLGMRIDAQTLATYTERDIIAHCLWEMTFLGYSPEVITEQRTALMDWSGDKNPHMWEDIQNEWDDTPPARLDKTSEDNTLIKRVSGELDGGV